MEWKNPHTSNCMKVRFVACYLQILQKPLSTDTADTIFVLYFELCQLRNALGISTAKKKIFVSDICAIHSSIQFELGVRRVFTSGPETDS